MDTGDEIETYNPWSIVHLVFEHLSDQGLHPTLGDGGDPRVHAEGLLRALHVQPSAEGNRAVVAAVRSQLAELRAAFDEHPGGAATPDSADPVST